MHIIEPDRSARTRHRRVLLVEDDVAHARLMRRALRDIKCPPELHHVMSGEDAIAHLEAAAGPDRRAPVYDLILVDVRLPGADGVTVLNWIKSEPSLRLVPVVMVSTSDQPADVNRCYDGGANAFVTKPTLFDDFIARLHGLMAFWLESAALPTVANHESAASHHR